MVLDWLAHEFDIGWILYTLPLIYLTYKLQTKQFPLDPMQKKTYTNICVSDFMHKLMFDWFSSFFYRQCIILEIVFVDINSIKLNHAVGRIEQNSGSFSTNNIGHRFIFEMDALWHQGIDSIRIS